MKKKEIKEIVREKYKITALATKPACCGCQKENNISKSIGYTDKDLELVKGANMGLGCGNPLSYSKINKGDVVLDLGCGAGIDVILASEKVGKSGKVIGIDMTEEMINKAKENARKSNISNADFIVAEIESLPLDDNSVDIIITNCVINLTPDKTEAFREAYRVLKPKGKMYLSDIVLLEELSEEQKNDGELLSGCVSGALQKEDYLKKIINVGFDVKIILENKNISKDQYQGINLESLTVELTK
jgi:arsenite methyltransferase